MWAFEVSITFVFGGRASIVFALPDRGLIEKVSPVAQLTVDFSMVGQIHALKVVQDVGFGSHGSNAGNSLWVTEQA